MSVTPTNHESQLADVLQAGFDCFVADDALRVGPVPCRLAGGSVSSGHLICHLHRSGEDIALPSDHTASWIGEDVPHSSDGRPMETLIVDRSAVTWSTGETSICTMSRLGAEPYASYGQKMLVYARIIAREAHSEWRIIQSSGALEVSDTSRMADRESGLNRVRIGHLSPLLDAENVAVVGAGGTGGHIVDLISKLNIRQLDIYDPDRVSVHTQLRWPGTVEREFAEQNTNKAEYLALRYSRRANRNIRGHNYAITENNLTLLNGKTMVFVAVDDGRSRHEILTGLARRGINFIDCGIDLGNDGGPLTASVRITRCQSEDDCEKRIELASRAPASKHSGGDDLYARNNIQTGEINSLNAALAVTAWKQGIGFYKDVHGYRRCRMHTASSMWALYDPKYSSALQ